MSSQNRIVVGREQREYSMEALRASYGDDPSYSDSKSPTQPPTLTISREQSSSLPLPPPPLSLLNPPNSVGSLDYSPSGQPSRFRSLRQVEGNYALYVYIPVRIPSAPKKDIALFLKRVARLVPGLYAVDVGVALDVLWKDDDKLEQVALGRKFHISLGRTVPIRVHQIDSVMTRLRQRLQFQRQYWIDFNKWEVFVNDDCTRTFLSLEVTATGLDAVKKQIKAVNEVYKLHNLPEFYKYPRPHISLAWALGDISNSLKRAIQERKLAVGGSQQNCFFTSKFSGIKCRIGNKSYTICKFSDT